MGDATYFVTRTLHTKIQRYLTNNRTKKEGVYAISMGIIHGNIFEHVLRVCHLVVINNLDSTSILNTAASGRFSSDRTIAEYNQEIWKLESLPPVTGEQ